MCFTYPKQSWHLKEDTKTKWSGKISGSLNYSNCWSCFFLHWWVGFWVLSLPPGVAPLLPLQRSFSALIRHFYCLIFCRYIELRSCKKMSKKYQNLSKEIISDHRKENGAQDFPVMDLECHKTLEEALFHQKLLKVILFRGHKYHYCWYCSAFRNIHGSWVKN